jgi:hypothetical protein
MLDRTINEMIRKDDVIRRMRASMLNLLYVLGKEGFPADSDEDQFMEEAEKLIEETNPS